MKQFNISIAICFFAALFGFDSWSATYYVSPTGNDSSSGSSTAPWKTPYKAFRATLKPGDIVYFRSGNYTMTGDGISVRSSGTSTTPITFASAPNQTAVIVYDRQKKLVEPTLAPVVYIGSSNIVVDRLSIRQVEASRVYTAASVDQTVTGFSVWGNNVKIRNCSIDNVSGLGVFVKGSNVLVENCKIFNHRSHSFYVAGANGIFRNNSLNCSRGYWNQRCIQIQYASSIGNRIYGNLVMNGQAAGVVFSGPVTNNWVYNNIFISNGAKLDTGHGLFGVVLDFWYETGKNPGTGNRFFNNTIMGKKPNSSLINPSFGTNVEVSNNIFRTTMPAVIGGIASKTKNNVFFNTSGSVPSGNITKDPKLANPAGTTAASAKFLSGSSAYNTGIDTGIRVDYFGTARPRGGRLDIGAYEY